MKKIITTLLGLLTVTIIACSGAESTNETIATAGQSIVTSNLQCPLPPFGTFATEGFTINSGNCSGVTPLLVEMVSTTGSQLPQDYPWNAYLCHTGTVSSQTQGDGSCLVTYNVDLCNINNAPNNAYSEGYVGTASFYQDGGGVWHLTGTETMKFHGNGFKHPPQFPCTESVSFSMN